MIGIDEVSRSKGQRYLTLVYDLERARLVWVGEAACTHAAAAQIVFGRFHVVQHLNRALDDVRRALWRALRGEEKSAFKRTRWAVAQEPLEPDQRRATAPERALLEELALGTGLLPEKRPSSATGTTGGPLGNVVLAAVVLVGGAQPPGALPTLHPPASVSP